MCCYYEQSESKSYVLFILLLCDTSCNVFNLEEFIECSSNKSKPLLDKLWSELDSAMY